MLRDTLNNRNVIAIGALLCILSSLVGIFSMSLFDEAVVEIDKDYTKALKFNDDNAQEFPYAVSTQQGNLVAEGEIKPASSLLTDPNLPGAYLAIREIKEEYRMHTETYLCNCRTVNSSTQCSTCTRTYWSWDYAGQRTQQVERISLLGQEMDGGLMPWANGHFVETRLSDGDRYLDTGHDQRSSFETVSVGIRGTFGFTSDQQGLRYNESINGPRGDTVRAIGIGVSTLLAILGIAGSVYFVFCNYEPFGDHYV